MRAEIKANHASGIMVTHSHAAAATADRVLILAKDGLHPSGLGDQADIYHTAQAVADQG
jgi:putative ABC transport system ATP-binding protein